MKVLVINCTPWCNTHEPHALECKKEELVEFCSKID